MNNLTKELSYESLRDNFNDVSEQINSGSDAMTLNLKSGRKVYIVPEENYDNISNFVMINTSSGTLTK
jgi:PHD/YefM family antitoxin component YafN of YafNO toxin-antitoxin module